MLIWFFIGSAVGVVMGTTGAGGTMIAVPLFITLWGSDIYDATTFALYCLFLASTLNWFVQKKNIFPKISILVSACSYVTAHFTAKIKAATPEWAITTLFISICAYSFYSLWFAKKPKPIGLQKLTVSFWLKIVALGLFLGIVTTLTGLGGGVIIVPLLIVLAGLNPSQAVATSLLTVSIGSLGSMYFQRERLLAGFDLNLIIALAVGTLLAAQILGYFAKKWPQERVNLVRKGVLTAVLTISVSTLLIRSFL